MNRRRFLAGFSAALIAPSLLRRPALAPAELPTIDPLVPIDVERATCYTQYARLALTNNFYSTPYSMSKTFPSDATKSWLTSTSGGAARLFVGLFPRRRNMSSTIQAPNRTLDQRFAALEHANHIRMERAKLKGEIKCGSLSAQDAIRVPAQFVLTMKLFDILCAIPGRGHVKASVAMNACRISHSKTVGGLSDRQRIVIIDYLDAL